jgi:hypothetical protein
MDYRYLGSIFRGPLTGVTIGDYPTPVMQLGPRQSLGDLIDPPASNSNPLALPGFEGAKLYGRSQARTRARAPPARTRAQGLGRAVALAPPPIQALAPGSRRWLVSLSVSEAAGRDRALGDLPGEDPPVRARPGAFKRPPALPAGNRLPMARSCGRAWGARRPKIRRPVCRRAAATRRSARSSRHGTRRRPTGSTVCARRPPSAVRARALGTLSRGSHPESAASFRVARGGVRRVRAEAGGAGPPRRARGAGPGLRAHAELRRGRRDRGARPGGKGKELLLSRSPPYDAM